MESRSLRPILDGSDTSELGCVGDLQFRWEDTGDPGECRSQAERQGIHAGGSHAHRARHGAVLGNGPDLKAEGCLL